MEKINKAKALIIMGLLLIVGVIFFLLFGLDSYKTKKVGGITNLSGKAQIKGDINGDGIVDSSDYGFVEYYVRNGFQNMKADVNGDGKVNSNDLTYIRKIIDDNAIEVVYKGGDGTTGHISNHKCYYGGVCSIKSNDFSKSGYVFTGWTTNKNGKDDNYGWTDWSGSWKYFDGQYGIKNNNLTLYAMWEKQEKNKNIIIYHGNGADGGWNQRQICTLDKKCAIKSPNYIKIGYVFKGWTTNKNGTDDGYNWTDWNGKWISDYNNKYGVKNNVLHLYAMWEAINSSKYLIVYHGNNSNENNVSMHMCENGKLCTIKENSFVKNGYVFVGWTTNENGKDDKYGWTTKTKEKVTYWQGTWSYVNGQYGINNNTLNLYAMWSPIYNVVYESNGATSGKVKSHDCNGTFKCNISTNKNGYTKTDYVFSGWTTKKDGTSDGFNWNGEWKYNDVKEKIKENKLTLYAKWSKNRIHFISGDTSYNQKGEQNAKDNTHYNVNQSILLESNGKYAMIDMNTSYNYQKYVKPYLEQLGVKELEFVIITHFHNDHYGGLSTYLKEKKHSFTIKNVIFKSDCRERSLLYIPSTKDGVKAKDENVSQKRHCFLVDSKDGIKYSWIENEINKLLEDDGKSTNAKGNPIGLLEKNNIKYINPQSNAKTKTIKEDGKEKNILVYDLKLGEMELTLTNLDWVYQEASWQDDNIMSLITMIKIPKHLENDYYRVITFGDSILDSVNKDAVNMITEDGKKKIDILNVGHHGEILPTTTYAQKSLSNIIMINGTCVSSLLTTQNGNNRMQNQWVLEQYTCVHEQKKNKNVVCHLDDVNDSGNQYYPENVKNKKDSNDIKFYFVNNASNENMQDKYSKNTNRLAIVADFKDKVIDVKDAIFTNNKTLKMTSTISLSSNEVKKYTFLDSSSKKIINLCGFNKKYTVPEEKRG